MKLCVSSLNSRILPCELAVKIAPGIGGFITRQSFDIYKMQQTFIRLFVWEIVFLLYIS